MHIGQALDVILKENGISSQWLADRSGCSRQMVSRLRNGHQAVQSDSLEKLLEALPGELAFQLISLVLNKRKTAISNDKKDTPTEEIQTTDISISIERLVSMSEREFSTVLNILAESLERRKQFVNSQQENEEERILVRV